MFSSSSITTMNPSLQQNLMGVESIIVRAAKSILTPSGIPIYSESDITALVEAGKKVYTGQSVKDVELAHLVRIGMEHLVFNNAWFQTTSREGKCLFEGSLADEATKLGVDVCKYNERALTYFNNRTAVAASLALGGGMNPISASPSPLTVPKDAYMPGLSPNRDATGKTAAVANYDSVRHHISLIEEVDLTGPSFTGLRLEQKFPMEFAVPPQIKTDACMIYLLDQAEIDNRERDYLDEIHLLRRQSQARFFKAVGMTLDPAYSYPGGYRTKSGKPSALEVEFNKQIFSSRRDFYHANPDKTDLSALAPSSDGEMKKAFDELKKAARTVTKGGGLEGAISVGKRKKPDS